MEGLLLILVVLGLPLLALAALTLLGHGAGRLYAAVFCRRRRRRGGRGGRGSFPSSRCGFDQALGSETSRLSAYASGDRIEAIWPTCLGWAPLSRARPRLPRLSQRAREAPPEALREM
jgi:hypothetical protein